ncbi:MAG: cytochrome o ubiquinol oxidase subunit III [Parachlamydiaceae bacterium]
MNPEHIEYLDETTIHHTREPNPDLSVPDPHQDVFSKTYMGFWIYLMSDCLIFATLFATYAVLKNSTFGGPTSKEIFELPIAFANTMILLLSSVTCGFAVLASLKNNVQSTLRWLGLTFLLGAAFLSIELYEFYVLIADGNGWQRSAFLSSFFTLVGTHGLHVTFGLLWLVVIAAQIYYQSINKDTFRRLVLFSLFWHFLDVVWIFIFTFVYLMGVI